MTNERYYVKIYDEEYYIFDSEVLPEKEFDERIEYDEYKLFEKSLTPKEIVDLLNENEELKENCKNYSWYRQYKIILDENEELQSELEELKEILNEYEQKLFEWKKRVLLLEKKYNEGDSVK